MLCRPKPSRLNSPRGLVGDLFIVQFNIMIISQTKSLITTHYVCLNYLGFNGSTSRQFLKLKPKLFNSCFQHKDKLDFYIDCIVQLHQNWLRLKRLSSIIACHKKFKQGSQLLWPCNWSEALWQEIHVLISPSVCKIHGGGPYCLSHNIPVELYCDTYSSSPPGLPGGPQSPPWSHTGCWFRSSELELLEWLWWRKPMVEWGRILWRLSCNIVRINTVINIVRVNIETVNTVYIRIVQHRWWSRAASFDVSHVT